MNCLSTASNENSFRISAVREPTVSILFSRDCAFVGVGEGPTVGITGVGSMTCPGLNVGVGMGVDVGSGVGEGAGVGDGGTGVGVTMITGNAVADGSSVGASASEAVGSLEQAANKGRKTNRNARYLTLTPIPVHRIK